MKKCSLILVALLVIANSALAIPKTVQDLRNMARTQLKTGVSLGNIPAINVAEFISVGDAGLKLDDNDIVFTVEYPNKEVRIYPQKILVWHEVINEKVQNKPYAVTYCPLTGTVATYESLVIGQYLILDNFGTLYNSNSTLIDRNTGSLWSQFLGTAFDGQLFGLVLNPVQTYVTTWQYAKYYYPDAKVLEKPRGTGRDYGRDPYGQYYFNDRIDYPLTFYNPLKEAKDNVLGITDGEFVTAIDIKYVKEKKLVNFYTGLTPYVAIYDNKLDVVRIFNRKVWNNDAIFTIENGKILDIYTKSEWNAQGKCIQGKLETAFLDEKYAMQTYWFAWAAFYPETEVIPGPNQVPDNALIFNEEIKK